MQPNVERLHFMDSMRAILMMLGVVYHSIFVYIPEFYFPEFKYLIPSTLPNDFAKPLATAIHVFRMPAFFVVSGFFCVFSLKKYGSGKFLRVRVVRILVPLIVTGATLNSLQMALVTNHTMTDFSLHNYLLGGRWIIHLWFLINLLVYFLIAAFLMYLAERPLSRVMDRINKVLSALPMLSVVFLMPIATLGIYSLKTIFGIRLEPWDYFLGVFDYATMLLYSPYFIFGAILATEGKLLSKFSEINPVFLVPLIVFADYARAFADGLSHFVKTVTLVYLESLIVWLATALCFYMFRTFFNKASSSWLFLSDAAYTVYLFHNVVVYSIGIILIRNNVNGFIGLPILIIATAFVTLAIHAYIIRKSRVAHMLFNGKWS